MLLGDVPSLMAAHEMTEDEASIRAEERAAAAAARGGSGCGSRRSGIRGRIVLDRARNRARYSGLLATARHRSRRHRTSCRRAPAPSRWAWWQPRPQRAVKKPSLLALPACSCDKGTLPLA
ncbi:MAG: hypothetical protein ACLTMP_14245 [Eggerthella lenta]